MAGAHHADCDGWMTGHMFAGESEIAGGRRLYVSSCTCGWRAIGSYGSRAGALSTFNHEHGGLPGQVPCDGRCMEWDAA